MPGFPIVIFDFLLVWIFYTLKAVFYIVNG
jgi:hypothetical protein